MSRILLVIISVLVAHSSSSADLILEPQELAERLSVGYAVQLVDMNDDGRLDIVVVDTDRVIWLENPLRGLDAAPAPWPVHTLIEQQTKTDNVSLAAADIDGDGRVDFALGADWRPSDTRTSGSLQWLARTSSPDSKWTVHPIGTEPTIHRIRFADLDSDGRPELIVVPLFGRGSTGPNFAEAPLRILSYKIPADPVKGPWRAEVLNDELHVAHNFWPTDFDRDGQLDLLVASFEGVSLLKRQTDGKWQRTLLGSGNQQTSPSRGASEIKHGRLASGDDYLATIEPWHGFQVVVYTQPPEGDAQSDPAGAPPLWTRHVLDDELKWGHAVSCVDLDGDGAEELVIGVRDSKDADHPCGLRIYDPIESNSSPGTPASGAGNAATPLQWSKQSVDPGGVAIEDLVCGDLNGDGRPDIVAVGRQTKNVRIYWNRGPAVAESP
jgi:hypothetical protein